MSGDLQSVAHSVRLLRLLTQKGPLGVTALAKELDIGTSTTHRLLSTLVHEGVVMRRPNGRAYSLVEGVAVAPARVALDRVLAAAPLIMEQLRDASEETVHIAVLSGKSIVYAASVESHQMMRVTSRVGEKAPAHLSAAGKILLAQHPATELQLLYEAEKLERRTPHSIGTGSELREELAQARENGYARNISESEIGLYALAVPIRDHTGQTLCSLTISGPEIRISPWRDGPLSPRERELLHELRAGARQLEASLI